MCIKVTVAIDSLGNIVWICPLAPGTSSDVLIRDREGPSRVKGQFIDYQFGAHDGAYKGQVHVVCPYSGRKTLTLTDGDVVYIATFCLYNAASRDARHGTAFLKRISYGMSNNTHMHTCARALSLYIKRSLLNGGDHTHTHTHTRLYCL